MFKNLFHNLTAERFPIKEQIFFAKRLSFLLNAGLPLAQSLQIIADQTAQPRRQVRYAALLKEIENGQQLGSALQRHGKGLSGFTLAMVHIGEVSGTLAQSLAYLSEELIKRQILRRKIASSLAYPAIIASVTLSVTVLLIVYIFPKITPIFISLQVPLPLATRALMGMAGFLSRFGVWCAIAPILAGAAIVVARKKYAIACDAGDKLLLRLPIVGPLSRAYNLANVCRMLSVLLTSAMPIVDALTLAGSAQQNSRYRKALAASACSVGEGMPLAKSLSKYSRLFPNLLVQLVAIGEQTGNLPATLQYLAQSYESDVDGRTKNLSVAVEPVLMLVMGLTIGFVAISIITPIYGITEHLQ